MISGTKSVIGLGETEGKFFLDSVTSVGHSSSEGKPMTLKLQKVLLKRYFTQSTPNTKNVTKPIGTHLIIFPSWSTSESPQNKGLTDTSIVTNQKNEAGFISFSS